MATFVNGAHYQVEVLDHSMDETPQGNPRINFKVKVLQKITGFGTDAPHFSPAEMNVDRNFGLVFATEKQKEFNIKKLRFAGWRGNDFNDFDMVGQTIICVNTHQQGEGKNSGKVYDNFDLALPPLAGADLSPEKKGMKKKMNALLGKMLKDNPAPPADEAPPEAKGNTSTKTPAKESDDSAGDTGAGGDETPF